MTQQKNEGLSDDRKITLSEITKPSAIKARAMEKRKERGTTKKHPTEWKMFNDYIAGGFGQFSDGELTVVAAETNVGKSTFVTNIALHMMNAGTKVDYISLEDSYPNVYDSICEVAGVDDLDDLDDLLVFPKESMIFGEEAWGSSDLMHHMEQMVLIRKVEFFVLDHLQFMFENETQAGTDNENARVRVVMRKLSRFATKHGVTIIAVSHMNKPQQVGTKRQRPDMHRVYGSKAIIDAAMKVLLLDEVPSDLEVADGKRYVDVKVFKQRYARKPQEWFRFDTTNKSWVEKGVLSNDDN